MKTRFWKPSPAMAIGIAALFFALGGGAVAASHSYLITSTTQIKPSVLKHLKGAKGSRGHQGVKGDTGAIGATGATGATGAKGTTTVVRRFAVGAAGASFSIAEATCNAGETVTGGGADYQTYTGAAIPVVRWNAPTPYGNTNDPATGWEAVIDNRGPSGTVTAAAWVMCAQT